MTVKSGNEKRTRSNAKNFTYEQAQKRLTETVKPFNQQVINSLFVDAVECNYFMVQDRTGRPCSCQKQSIATDGNTNVPVSAPEPRASGGNGMFELVLQDGDFLGEKAERNIIDVTGDVPIIQVADSESTFEDGIFGANSVNCGICHKIGLQPGYQPYGKQRVLLTHYDVAELRSFQIDRSEQPHLMRITDKSGYVEYKVKVPLVFTKVRFRIYENHAPVQDIPTMRDGRPIDVLFFRQCAGHETIIRVHSSHTHVILEFDLGIPPMRVNISGENKSIDYERLETMSDITVILPPTIHEVNARDIIIIGGRRLALRVTDKDRKITADKRPLEWSVTTRVLQPTEQIKRIDDLRKLL